VLFDWRCMRQMIWVVGWVDLFRAGVPGVVEAWQLRCKFWKALDTCVGSSVLIGLVFGVYTLYMTT
jgi:hypothetical protein